MKEFVSGIYIEIACLLPVFFLLGQLPPSLPDRKSSNFSTRVEPYGLLVAGVRVAAFRRVGACAGGTAPTLTVRRVTASRIENDPPFKIRAGLFREWGWRL